MSYSQGYTDGIEAQKAHDKIILVFLEKKKNKKFQVRIKFADLTEQVFDLDK